MEDIKLKRALTYDDIKNTKRQYIPFTGEFQEVFSRPQDKGVWLIWGASGSGKSSFVMQLVAELAKYYKVLYNSLEEEPDDDEYGYQVELAATLLPDNGKSFLGYELLMKVHNQQANKELGDHVFYEGTEIERGEDGIAILPIYCGS